MARLIHILAASVGGGLMLGAGIRLGEALVSRDAGVARVPEPGGGLAARLGALEDRLRQIDHEGSGAPNGKQTANVEAVEAIRSQLETGGEKLEALNEMSMNLRSELQGWLEDSVSIRMADVESKLRAESERTQRQMLDVFVESVQTRVMNRIAKLEEEVSGQSAAMIELRECSLRTEQSIQKLLGGLDRLIVPQRPPSPSLTEEPASPPEEAAAADLPKPVDEPEAPVLEAPLARPRRWGIFG